MTSGGDATGSHEERIDHVPSGDDAFDGGDAPTDTGGDDAATAAAVSPPADRGSGRPASLAPVIEGDWLASVCPYLASDDGTYRSATPDEGNRCTAQDPPASLPLAFQERFCLTDRHPRCEMYKFAQERGAAASVPMDEVVAMGTRPLRAARTSGAGRGWSGVDRRIIAGAAGLAGLAVLVIVLVLLVGSCSSGPGGTPGESVPPGSQASDRPPATAEPPATVEPRQTAPASGEPGDSPGPADGFADSGLVIRYEVQQGEALLKVADTFGVTRRRLYRMNEGLEEIAPAELPGQVILVPVPVGMTPEDLEALDGYLGPADEG